VRQRVVVGALSNSLDAGQYVIDIPHIIHEYMVYIYIHTYIYYLYFSMLQLIIATGKQYRPLFFYWLLHAHFQYMDTILLFIHLPHFTPLILVLSLALCLSVCLSPQFTPFFLFFSFFCCCCCYFSGQSTIYNNLIISTNQYKHINWVKLF
jgi:hypothetical protein